MDYVRVMLTLSSLVLLLLTLATCAMVGYAATLGWVLNRFLPVTYSEGMFLTMGAMVVVALFIWAIARVVTAMPIVETETTSCIEDDTSDTREGHELGHLVIVTRLPDAKCHCGSRRKYKNCHGALRRSPASLG